MGKPLKKSNTIQRAIATSSAVYNSSQPTKASITTDFPTGNLSIFDLGLRWGGNLNLSTSSAGTIVTDGEKLHLRDIYLDTDQHGPIVSGGMDGLMLDRINRYRRGTAPQATTISAATTGTPAFSATAMIPFGDYGLYRHYDGIVYMGKSVMRLYAQMGINTDFISGGTYTTEDIQVNTLDAWTNIVLDPVPATYGSDGKIVDLGEDPLFVPAFDVIKQSVASTGTLQVSLPVRDRVYSRIYIFQRNSSTLAELSTVIVATANVSLVLNGQNWLGPNTLFQDIQAENKLIQAEESLPTGMAVIDFAKDGRINSMLSVIDKSNQQLYLNIDVTSVSNGAVWIVLESYKPIPNSARR